MVNIMRSFVRAAGKKAAETRANAAPRPEHPEVRHADIMQMDAETREMYRDARAALTEDADDTGQAGSAGRKTRREFVLQRPFQLGFTVTLGALVAILFGQIIGQLSAILMYVAAALFIALGLDPIVSWLERKKVKRAFGIALVFGGFIAVIASILAIVIPMIAEQVTTLIASAPRLFSDITRQTWFQDIDNRFGDFIDFPELLRMGQNLISKPENWAQVAGGVWQASLGLANGLTATIIVLILTLYFLASMRTIKYGFYTLVPRTARAKVIDITEQVTKSVGAYVSGQALLALTNSVLGFIMMSIVQVPFAGLLTVGVFLFALIPLVGSLFATIMVVLVAFFNSPTAALAAAIYYLVYMQIEAYLISPRIMNRVVSVPGSLVVIGALAGGTLLNLLGALIAIPVTAMILMIIKQVWVPRQQLR